VLESFCRYRVPARFDDVLDVHARCLDVRGARFKYEYAIVREDGELVADGWTAHACVDATTLRPTRVPDWLADAIRTAESSSPASSS
jgi:acyl-CoA thioester hydrolase